MDAPRKDGGRCEGRTEELHLKVLENGHEIEVDIQDTNLSLKKYNDSGKDSPWSWVVTAATFVMHFIFYGFTYVIGIYFVSLLEAFHMGSTMTSFIGSIYIGCICCTGEYKQYILTAISPSSSASPKKTKKTTTNKQTKQNPVRINSTASM